MKIAVTYENGEIFQHFGHTEQFKLYEIEADNVVATEIVNSNGVGHGALAGFLQEQDVIALICGGIGGGARQALMYAGIQLFPGAHGNADAAVEALLKGELLFDPNIMCNHHHHEDGHSCGSHGCGEHGCGGSCH